MKSAVKFRKAEAQDLTFIVESWISSFKSAHAAGIMSISPLDAPCRDCGHAVPYDYESVMRVTITGILHRSDVDVWVAYNPREKPPNDLHGYVVSERNANIPSYDGGDFRVKPSPDPLIHFVFVKQLYRDLGLARALLKSAGIDPTKKLLYTCKTAVVPKLESAGKIPQAKWFPISVRFAKESKIP